MQKKIPLLNANEFIDPNESVEDSIQVAKNIEYMMRMQGITKAEFCRKLNLSPSAFSDWKAGRMKSYQKMIPQICEILKCSWDTLLIGDLSNADITYSDSDMTKDEQELLTMFRELTLMQKAELLYKLKELRNENR